MAQDEPDDDIAGVRRRATIEDVAAAAGVSVATVSRAMRGLPNVAFSTRERVAEVATRLAYRADPAATRLATGRSRSVALAVPLLNSWYFSQVVSGAEAVCSAEGYDMIVMGVTGDEDRRALVDETSSIHRRVDGIIFVDIPVSSDEAELLDHHDLAVVTVGNSTDRFPSLVIDDVHVGELAVGHLISLGHTRIAVIGGQRIDPLGFHVSDSRRAGYHAALDRADIVADPALAALGNYSVCGGRDAMQTLLALDEPPTAVFAMSDEMAFGALLAAREAGIEVPDELSVVGVDDHDVSVVVDLTTVRQPVADHGARAARLLISQLEGERVGPSRDERPVELVVRRSTAPCRPARVG